jgi:hypothetical protein
MFPTLSRTRRLRSSLHLFVLTSRTLVVVYGGKIGLEKMDDSRRQDAKEEELVEPEAEIQH